MRRAWLLLVLLICAQCNRADYASTGVARALKGASNRTLAPDFHLPTLSGDSLALSSLRGQVVVLNFWATWCKPCLAEMPALEELHRTMDSLGVSVVGISVDTADPQFVSHFVERLSISYPVVMADEDLSDAYSQLPANSALTIGDWGLIDRSTRKALDSMPTTFVIDRQGRSAIGLTGVVYNGDGIVDIGKIKEAVDLLLEDPSV